MYSLTVLIDTDDDFTYNDNEFGNRETATTYYYEKREDAIKALKNSYDSITKTIMVFNDQLTYIERRLNQFKPYLFMLCDKIPFFNVEIGFGNQSICYTLSKIEKEVCNNGYFYLTDLSDEDSSIDPIWYNLYIDGNWYEAYDWESLENLNDIT